MFPYKQGVTQPTEAFDSVFGSCMEESGRGNSDEWITGSQQSLEAIQLLRWDMMMPWFTSRDGEKWVGSAEVLKVK